MLKTSVSLPSNIIEINQLIETYQNNQIFFVLFKSNSLSLSKVSRALSSKDSASLTEPSEILTINLRASSDAFPFSFSLSFL